MLDKTAGDRPGPYHAALSVAYSVKYASSQDDHVTCNRRLIFLRQKVPFCTRRGPRRSMRSITRTTTTAASMRKMAQNDNKRMLLPQQPYDPTLRRRQNIRTGRHIGMMSTIGDSNKITTTSNDDDMVAAISLLLRCRGPRGLFHTLPRRDNRKRS